MPILKQAKKALRSSATKRVFNNRRRRTAKDTTKAITKLIKAGSKDEAMKIFPRAQQAIDKAVKAGILKKNTAARKKSRIAQAIKNIA